MAEDDFLAAWRFLARRCRWCKKHFQPKPRGRPALFCSASCRQRAYEKRKWIPQLQSLPPLSLTSLTIIEDETMPLTEVRVHPELAYRVRPAFVEADVLRSVHQFPHPFTSVGDEEIEE